MLQLFNVLELEPFKDKCFGPDSFWISVQHSVNPRKSNVYCSVSTLIYLQRKWNLKHNYLQVFKVH